MRLNLAIATPEANDSLRKAVTRYRQGSWRYTLSVVGLACLAILIGRVLYVYDTGSVTTWMGLLFVGIGLVLFAFAIYEVYIAAKVNQATKAGHVKLFPSAVLYHIRLLLNAHELEKFEQEFLTWLGSSQPHYQQLESGRSAWEAFRTEQRYNQVDAARLLLLELDILLAKFQNDPARSK